MNAKKQVAVVTGAARGVGLAIARKFLASGDAVALLDIDATTLATTTASLAAPTEVLSIVCDVSQPAEVEAAIAQVDRRFGRLDALVNNAGIAVFKPILETTVEDWTRVLATNLTGPFLCTQACAPLMLRSGGGSVVNIASISGVREHAACRLRHQQGGVDPLDEAAGRGARQRGHPRQLCGARPGRNRDGAAGPLGGHPHELSRRHSAESVRHGGRDRRRRRFLCSEAASFINGQMLAVDGGFYASGVGLPSLRSRE